IGIARKYKSSVTGTQNVVGTFVATASKSEISARTSCRSQSGQPYVEPSGIEGYIPIAGRAPSRYHRAPAYSLCDAVANIVFRAPDGILPNDVGFCLGIQALYE